MIKLWFYLGTIFMYYNILYVCNIVCILFLCQVHVYMFLVLSLYYSVSSETYVNVARTQSPYGIYFQIRYR